MGGQNADERTAHTTPDVSQVPTLFKYFSDHEDVINGIFMNGRIRFTQPAVLNDPLEFNPVIRFKQREGTYVRYCFDGVVFASPQYWL